MPLPPHRKWGSKKKGASGEASDQRLQGSISTFPAAPFLEQLLKEKALEYNEEYFEVFVGRLLARLPKPMPHTLANAVGLSRETSRAIQILLERRLNSRPKLATGWDTRGARSARQKSFATRASTRKSPALLRSNTESPSQSFKRHTAHAASGEPAPGAAFGNGGGDGSGLALEA